MIFEVLLLCSQDCLVAMKKILGGKKACLSLLSGNFGSTGMG